MLYDYYLSLIWISHFAIFFSVLFCASVSHELERHSVEIHKGTSEEHTLFYEHHENHLHDSVHHPEGAHDSDLACDFFHGDLGDIGFSSNAILSFIEETAEAEPFVNSSHSNNSFHYKARAPPKV